MLVQVRRTGVARQRRALAAVRRQQDDFAVAAFDVGREHRRDAPARHRLAEDQVPVGEVEADVFLDQREIADAVALVAVEAVLADGAGHIGGSPRPQAEDARSARRRDGRRMKPVYSEARYAERESEIHSKELCDS